MTADHLIKGFVIGLSVAAPVGPIGVLTIKRTLSEGRVSGFVTGLGAALADALYGAVAGFGLTAVSSALIAQGSWMKLVGGCFLLYLGIRSFLSKPATRAASIDSKGIFSNFISTFFLTVANPSTILSFIAIFAGFGIGFAGADYLSASMLVLGVFTGSALWWLILSSAVALFRDKITQNGLAWINRLSGTIIICFGLWACYTSDFLHR